MEQILNAGADQVQYVIKVNGVAISSPFGDRTVAEMARNNLPEEQKVLAEVVAVTTDGQQVLFG